MNSITEAIVTILLFVGGIALAAVVVSKNANTTGVIQAGASGFGNDLAVAVSPVSGASVTPNLTYPEGGDFSSAFGT